MDFLLFTEHARVRMQQRGKPPEGVKMVLRYGSAERHSVKRMLKKDVRRQIDRRRGWLERLARRGSKFYGAVKSRMRLLEKTDGWVVVSKNGKILTVYNQSTKGLKRRRMMRWRRDDAGQHSGG